MKACDNVWWTSASGRDHPSYFSLLIWLAWAYESFQCQESSRPASCVRKNNCHDFEVGEWCEVEIKNCAWTSAGIKTGRRMEVI